MHITDQKLSFDTTIYEVSNKLYWFFIQIIFLCVSFKPLSLFWIENYAVIKYHLF